LRRYEMDLRERVGVFFRLLLLPLTSMGVLAALSPLHWSGVFIDEHSRFRLLLVRRTRFPWTRINGNDESKEV
jgi:hypothetical protein